MVTVAVVAYVNGILSFVNRKECFTEWESRALEEMTENSKQKGNHTQMEFYREDTYIFHAHNRRIVLLLCGSNKSSGFCFNSCIL